MTQLGLGDLERLGGEIERRTEARTQKEGLGTGNLLDHFELIGMIDDVGVVQLENIPILLCGTGVRQVTQHHVNRYRRGVGIKMSLFTACCL